MRVDGATRKDTNMTRQPRRQDDRAITTNQALLTQSWTADVETLETAIGRFTARRPLVNACRVAFFEIAGDAQLHVNVTHQYPTKVVRGWTGPGITRNGFVHNRRFADTPPSEMIRHIRSMVFAARQPHSPRRLELTAGDQ